MILRRKLRYIDVRGDWHTVDQAHVLALTGPRIILGEPGQGKSVLLKTLATEAGLTFITAKQLLRAHDLGALRTPIVIDALDEVASARDTDAVQQILAKLAFLGRPPFILSCRAADWEGAVASADIEQDYGDPPILMWLEPLSRQDAVHFLEGASQISNPAGLVDDLEQRGMEGLYSNPLTLKLFIDTVGENGNVPASRGELFSAACDLLWREQAMQHARSALNDLTAEEALLAAGALCAVLILTGADALSTKPLAQLDEGDRPVRVATKLPYGAAALAVLRSRLFVGVGTGRFLSIHRVLAEYLGARWLAKLIDSGVSEARIFAMLTLGDTVPSSLRGLHAWIAAFSDRAARRVIANDPYGVLRYGDPEPLSDDRVRDLFGALEQLARVDPYFRASDWGKSGAKDLARTGVEPDIAGILTTSKNLHLRNLVLELLEGTPLATSLEPLLTELMMDPSVTFAERARAADALRGVVPRDQWPAILEHLRCLADQNSTRLAVEILTKLGMDAFSDDAVVSIVLAFLGYTLCPADGPANERPPIGVVSLFNWKFPGTRSVAVLDLVANYVPVTASDDNWERRWELEKLTSALFMQAVQVCKPSPAQYWRWVQLLDSNHGHDRSTRLNIEDYFRNHEADRRAVQRHVLFELSIDDSLWMRAFRLGDTLPILAASREDALILLTELGAAADRSEQARDAWRDLVRLTRSREGISREDRAVARVFARGDRELLQFLDKVSKPVSNTWEKKSEARRKREEGRKARAYAIHRADFNAHRGELEAGELKWIVPAARSYLALFQDTSREQAPLDRIAAWLGDDIAASAAIGFEAALLREDLPTPSQVVEGFADNRVWNMTYPMVAGLAERLRHGRALTDLRRDVLRACWLMLQHESWLDDHAKIETFIPDVERLLSRDPEAFAEDYRLLIEPRIRGKAEHIQGLYRLGRAKELVEVGSRLAVEWLNRYPDMHPNSESELVDRILGSPTPEALRPIMAQRLAAELDENRLLIWLSAAFAVDFDERREFLTEVAAQHPSLLFAIRGRLRTDDDGGEATVAKNSWLVAQFRGVWPDRDRPTSVTSGDSNAWDASDFIRGCINRLAADTSFEASDALAVLRDASLDSYSDYIRHAAAQQRRTRDEANFRPVTAEALIAMSTSAAPTSIDDLQAMLLDSLEVVQSKLRASETNPLDAFYDAAGLPQNENFCRDRLVEWIAREIPRSVVQATETRMPDDKRSDIAFVEGEFVVPVEIKAQWHPAVYDAAIGQLDRLYTKEWRARGRGIYVVLWFGSISAAGKRLTRPPNGGERPDTADALAALLTDRIPEANRGRLAVRVLDLSR